MAPGLINTVTEKRFPDGLAWHLSVTHKTSTIPRNPKPLAAHHNEEMGSGMPDAHGTAASGGQELPEQRLSGSISGTIVDPTGGAVAGARVRLSRDDQSPGQEVLSGDDG